MGFEQLKTVFQANNVTTALVVDDAFDPVELYNHDDLESAFALFEKDDEVENAFTSIGGQPPADPDALHRQLQGNPVLGEKLADALKDAARTPLRRLASAIYGVGAVERLEKLKPLDALRATLSEVGVSATLVGSAGPGDSAARYPLIFMDYYLGTGGAPSVAKSRDRIMEIVARYGPNEMPIVVLMSSLMTKDKVAFEFRDEAELLGCQFKFVPKSMFTDTAFDFAMSLADRVEVISQARSLCAFVQAWRKALGEAMKDFQKGVGQLDLQDYFQILMKISPDGASRFGEHLSGLFDGYLRQLVEDRPELRIAIAAVNKVKFESHPPSPFVPSDIVAKMAHASTFQSLPEPGGTRAAASNLELGDVFLRVVQIRGKRTIETCVVISQACDLEHGKTQTVLLLKGIATKRSPTKLSRQSDGRPILRTDLFQYGSEDLIIDWDAGDLLSPHLAGLDKWLLDMTYEKVARLRPVQALQLQQKFAAHLTRVGTPDTPPSYRFPNVDVLHVLGTTRAKLFDTLKRKDRYVCVVGDDKPEAVFEDRFVKKLRTALSALETPGVDQAELAKVVATLADYARLRELRGMRLREGKAYLDTVAILDRETPLTAGESLPKGAWLAIVLHSGD